MKTESPFGGVSFPYAVGRLRALEGGLLDRARWNRLIEAPDERQALRLLREFGYGGSADTLTEKHGVPCSLRLDSASVSFQGGVRILGGKSDVDASFESLLNELRETNEQKTAALLFGDAEYEPAR